MNEDWMRRWNPVGEVIVCWGCSGYQTLEDAHTPFQHRPDCTLALTVAQLPWRDLLAGLRRWKTSQELGKP
ncbi:hypothetical protein [Pseudomonas asiatica]|uniref:hypothetical protein n=1 Tax=Pseudomonas asiatica TaxID=2219225 RepID=UPI0025A4B191|nr:hypothetical protein [Pseudomonas asiatica]WJN48600.1 hypothetical protein QUR91_18350 [Pseudomonas asiatica]